MAVAKLINNSRTISAVRELRERQKDATVMPGWEYSIGGDEVVLVSSQGLRPLHLFLTKPEQKI
jgi:hypothetical protein